MSVVTVSPKFQVVIPKEVRESSNIKVGSKMDIFAFDGRIELVPLKTLKKLRGSLKGIDTSIVREKDRL